MKTQKRLLFILTLLIISTTYPPIGFTQDYTTLNLPESAKARIGKGIVEDLQFSPDNKLLAVVTSIGIWIHDITTGEDLELLTEQNTGAYTSVAFSPDGSMLASGHSDGTIQLWNVDNFTLIRTLTGHGGKVRYIVGTRPLSGVMSVVFSSDGITLASGGGDKTVRLWDVNTGRQKKILKEHTDVVTSVAFGPDPNDVDPRCPKEILASASWDKTVILWDLSTNQPKQTFTGHTHIITSVAISPNPMIPVLASGSWDGTIQMWDLSTGELKHTLTNEYKSRTNNICFKSDGYILMSSSERGVNLWATLSGAHKQQLEGTFACFSPDGSLIATSSAIPELDYSNFEEYKYGVKILAMHPAQIWGVEEGLSTIYGRSSVLSRDGKTTALGSVIYPPNDAKHRRHFEFYIYDTTQRPQEYPPIIKPKTIISTADWAEVPDICFDSDAKIVPDSSYWTSSELVSFGKANPDINTVCAVGGLDQWVVDYALSPDGQTLAVLLDWAIAKPFEQTVNMEREDGLHIGPGFEPRKFQSLDLEGFRSVLLFDTATGELESLYNLWTPGGYRGNGYVFSPDGLTLACKESEWDSNVGASIEYIVLKDIRSGSTRQSIRIPPGDGDFAGSIYIGFSPDSETIIYSDNSDTSIYMWDVASGSLKQTLSVGSTGSVSDMAYSPDGETIAIAMRHSDQINWWDVETGKHLFTKGSLGGYGIAFSRDGKTIWEYQYPLTMIWDVCTGEEIQFEAQNIVSHSEYSKDYSQYHDPYDRAELLPDEEGLTLQTDKYLSGFGTVGLYDLSGVVHSGLVFTGYERDAQSINQVSFSSDGKTLASAGNYIRLWDVETATPKSNHTLTLNTLSASNAVFNQFGIEALATSSWNEISVWSPSDDRRVARLTGHKDHITSLAFSPFPGSSTLASGSYDGTVKVWYHVRVGDSSASVTLSAHTGVVTSVAFSNPHGYGAGSTLASGSHDKTIKLWYPADPIVADTFENRLLGLTPTRSVTLTGHAERVTSLAFGPLYPAAFGPKHSGTLTLASGSFDSTVRLWKVKAGELNEDSVSLKHTLTGHKGPVTSVAFNRMGTLVASGGMDKTIRIWNPFIGKHLKTLKGHKGAVNSVSFSPDGNTLASGSADGTILLWDIDFHRIVVELKVDVNGDGTVNIQDLVQVAAAFGEGAAAPAAHATIIEHLTATEVKHWLYAAQHANLTDPTFQRGIEVLKQLLAALIPKETALLPNYPNPFNPETWIPYQLANPADVALRIYAVDGSLVRVLSLGHKAVGTYQTRARAAYWDGRNAVGEPVASGVYFYTLTAGDFNSTRKLLIRK